MQILKFIYYKIHNFVQIQKRKIIVITIILIKLSLHKCWKASIWPNLQHWGKNVAQQKEYRFKNFAFELSLKPFLSLIFQIINTNLYWGRLLESERCLEAFLLKSKYFNTSCMRTMTTITTITTITPTSSSLFTIKLYLEIKDKVNQTNTYLVF